MGRKKQNPEDSVKRAQVVSVAGRLFTTHGYSEVSMDAIAEAVPVSKRTLYNHFKDKSALFTAVMQGRCQMLSGRLKDALHEDRDHETALKAFGRQYLDIVFAPAGVNIYRTIIMESQHFPELGALFYASGPERTMGLLADYLQTLHDRKILAIPNPSLSANLFLSMLANRLQMKCMLGLRKHIKDVEKNEIIEQVVRIFLYGQQR